MLNKQYCLGALFLKNNYFFIAIVFLLFLLSFNSVFPYSGNNDKEIKKSVAVFFYSFQQKKYKNAYNMFAESLKMEIPYRYFHRKALDIKEAHIKELKIYDQGKYLVKMNVRVRLKMVYNGSLYSALYKGTCDVVKEKKEWRLASVKLTSEESEFIKHLNFSKD